MFQRGGIAGSGAGTGAMGGEKVLAPDGRFRARSDIGARIVPDARNELVSLARDRENILVTLCAIAEQLAHEPDVFDDSRVGRILVLPDAGDQLVFRDRLADRSNEMEQDAENLG